MRRRNFKTWVAALLCGGTPLVINVTCDPYYGVLDIYRDAGPRVYMTLYSPGGNSTCSPLWR